MKMIRFFALATLVLCVALFFVSCELSSDEATMASSDAETSSDAAISSGAKIISAEDFEITGAELSMSVPNATTEYSFVGKIKVSDKATWTVSADKYGRETYLSKAVPLREGENRYYLIVTSDDGEQISTYTVTIQRTPTPPVIYTVTYDLAGGTLTGSNPTTYTTDNDNVTLIEPTRTDYTFLGWYTPNGRKVAELRGYRENLTLTAKWEYLITVDESGTIIATSKLFKETKTEFTIPTSLDGVRITAIGNEAFSWCKELTSITIPSNIVSIGNHAFSGCQKLTSIKIPDSVTSLGVYALYNCAALTSAVIGNGVKEITSHMFAYCPSLSSITIGSGVTSIGEHAFFSCTALKSFTVPAKVTAIEPEAFSCCDALESVTFANPNGWYTTMTEGASTGTTMYVAYDPSSNAAGLNFYSSYYYWYRK